MNFRLGSLLVFCLLSLYVANGRQRTLFYEPDTSLRIDGSSSFNYLNVIDHRTESNLGTVSLGLYSKKATIKIKRPLGKILSSYTETLLRRADKGADTAVLVLDDFRFETSPPAAIYYLKGQIFIGRNNNYKLVKNLDTFYVWTNNLLEKTMFAESSRYFSDLLKEIAAIKISSEAPGYTLQEASRWLFDEKKKIPIYGSAGFKKGVYQTLDDFLDHRPSDSAFIQGSILKDFSKIPEFYYVNSKGKKIAYVRSVFAVYNGHEWYRRGKDGWKTMRYQSGEFYSEEDFKYVETGNNTAMFVLVGVFFGAIGGVVAAATMPPQVRTFEARLNPITKKFRPVRELQ